MSSDPDVRAISEGELGAWAYVLDASFLLPVPAGAVAYRQELYVPGRSLGAFDSGRCVGTLRSLDLEVTVPGGAAVPAERVTNVAVLGSHRRRGLLSRMMRAALDDAVARGHGLAALIASEYRIYGRFGFGPATSEAGYDVHVRRAGDVRVPGADGGSLESLSLDEVREYGPELHERFRRTQVGAIPRGPAAWRMRTGALRNPYQEWEEPSALWRHLLTTEWVNEVTAANIAPDDPLPLLLGNPRACVPRASTGRDHLWLRLLDVARTLESRTYGEEGRLVLDVTDGRGSVGPVSEPADLALDVSVLGTIYLGDQTVPRLATAGLIAERRAGAISRADRMLRTAARPWCPDGF